jgi:hypothetical protein
MTPKRGLSVVSPHPMVCPLLLHSTSKEAGHVSRLQSFLASRRAAVTEPTSIIKPEVSLSHALARWCPPCGVHAPHSSSILAPARPHRDPDHGCQKHTFIKESPG